MKSKKLSLIVSIILVLTILCGTFSVAAAEIPSTSPAGDNTTEDEYSEDYWDGYYDGYYDGVEDTENEDYDSGYEDGYYDGVNDGYWDGYYEGYYDGTNAYEDPTIFDKWDNFVEELIYRIELFCARIRDIIERIFRIGDYAPITPIDPDAGFIPDGSQATLAGNEGIQALCDEFNDLIYNFKEVIPESVAITKKVDVGIAVKEVPSVVQGIVNELVENFLIDDSTTNYYEAGDYAYEVQSIELYPAGLTEATKTVNADGTTDYKFVVIEEAAYYNGYYTTGVKLVDGEIVETDLQHDYVADTLYIEVADLEPITIKSAEIVYPGATITAKTDANGRLIAYNIDMPVSGTGTAKVAMIDLTASLEGYRNEGFVMEYDA